MPSDYSFHMVLVAGLLPYVFTIVAKLGNAHPFDNHDPRESLRHTTGVQRRANNAQLNSFEAFPLFATGVIVAHLKHADVTTLNRVSAGFVLARVAYGVAYLADWDTTRTSVWCVGLALACLLYGI